MPTILICDDEPSLRELMRISLASDYSFAEAEDTAEALAQIERLLPDLVLLDMMMPGGSGLDVLERVRSDPRISRTPVVIVSAFASDGDRVKARDAGASGFIGKPFDPDELVGRAMQLVPA